MSRETWYAGTGKPASFDSLGAPRRKLSLITTDPQAAEHDEACEIFLSGVRLGCIGDFAAATPQIACAYLLDSRSINFAVMLPQDLEASKRNFILDYELLGKLIERDEQSFGSSVLRILLATFLGHSPFGQQLIAAAMVHVSKLYECIDSDRAIEAPGSVYLGGASQGKYCYVNAVLCTWLWVISNLLSKISLKLLKLMRTTLMHERREHVSGLLQSSKDMMSSTVSSNGS